MPTAALPPAIDPRVDRVVNRPPTIFELDGKPAEKEDADDGSGVDAAQLLERESHLEEIMEVLAKEFVASAYVPDTTTRLVSDRDIDQTIEDAIDGISDGLEALHLGGRRASSAAASAPSGQQSSGEASRTGSGTDDDEEEDEAARHQKSVVELLKQKQVVIKHFVDVAVDAARKHCQPYTHPERAYLKKMLAEKNKQFFDLSKRLDTANRKMRELKERLDSATPMTATPPPDHIDMPTHSRPRTPDMPPAASVPVFSFVARDVPTPTGDGNDRDGDADRAGQKRRPQGTSSRMAVQMKVAKLRQKQATAWRYLEAAERERLEAADIDAASIQQQFTADSSEPRHDDAQRSPTTSEPDAAVRRGTSTASAPQQQQTLEHQRSAMRERRATRLAPPLDYRADAKSEENISCLLNHIAALPSSETLQRITKFAEDFRRDTLKRGGMTSTESALLRRSVSRRSAPQPAEDAAASPLAGIGTPAMSMTFRSDTADGDASEAVGSPSGQGNADAKVSAPRATRVSGSQKSVKKHASTKASKDGATAKSAVRSSESRGPPAPKPQRKKSVVLREPEAKPSAITPPAASLTPPAAAASLIEDTAEEASASERELTHEPSSESESASAQPTPREAGGGRSPTFDAAVGGGDVRVAHVGGQTTPPQLPTAVDRGSSAISMARSSRLATQDQATSAMASLHVSRHQSAAAARAAELPAPAPVLTVRPRSTEPLTTAMDEPVAVPKAAPPTPPPPPITRPVGTQTVPVMQVQAGCNPVAEIVEQVEATPIARYDAVSQTDLEVFAVSHNASRRGSRRASSSSRGGIGHELGSVRPRHAGPHAAALGNMHADLSGSPDSPDGSARRGAHGKTPSVVPLSRPLPAPLDGGGKASGSAPAEGPASLLPAVDKARSRRLAEQQLRANTPGPTAGSSSLPTASRPPRARPVGDGSSGAQQPTWSPQPFEEFAASHPAFEAHLRRTGV